MSRDIFFCKKGDFLSDSMNCNKIFFLSSERLSSKYDEISLIHTDHLTYFKIPSSFMKANMRYDRLMERYLLKKNINISFLDIKDFVFDVVDVRGKINEARGSFNLIKKTTCKNV